MGSLLPLVAQSFLNAVAGNTVYDEVMCSMLLGSAAQFTLAGKTFRRLAQLNGVPTW
jgi:hypothetical protein